MGDREGSRGLAAEQTKIQGRALYWELWSRGVQLLRRETVAKWGGRVGPGGSHSQGAQEGPHSGGGGQAAPEAKEQ